MPLGIRRILERFCLAYLTIRCCSLGDSIGTDMVARSKTGLISRENGEIFIEDLQLIYHKFHLSLQ
ncbi:MAG: hypothetical protein WCF14_11300, partial [Nitrososphaeraceae archaeon]